MAHKIQPITGSNTSQSQWHTKFNQLQVPIHLNFNTYVEIFVFINTVNMVPQPVDFIIILYIIH